MLSKLDGGIDTHSERAFGYCRISDVLLLLILIWKYENIHNPRMFFIEKSGAEFPIPLLDCCLLHHIHFQCVDIVLYKCQW